MELIDSYYRGERVSQSRLKKILIHPRMFLKDADIDAPKVPKENILIGNAVDCLISEPELWDKKFKRIDGPPEIKGGMFKDFLEELFKTKKPVLEGEISEESWFTTCFSRVTTQNTKFKLENFILEYNNGEHPYYRFLIESEKIAYVDNATYEKILEIKNNLLFHPFTKHCFEGEVLFQLEIEWEHKNIEFKSKLDMVHIDRVNKILTIRDIKTTEKIRDFKNVFERFRYDIQVAAYLTALNQWKQNNEFNEYKISGFEFVVEEVSYPGNPKIFTLCGDTLSKAFGDFNLACDKYNYHTSNNLWDYTMEEYESNGVVCL